MIQDQPAPTKDARSVTVTNEILIDLRRHFSASTPALQVASDLLERSRVGVQTYGTPLMTFNGRNAKVDAYQEVLDAAQYLKQEFLEAYADKRVAGRIYGMYWRALELAIDLREVIGLDPIGRGESAFTNEKAPLGPDETLLLR